jgi:hypothetical protein
MTGEAPAVAGDENPWSLSKPKRRRLVVADSPGSAGVREQQTNRGDEAGTEGDDSDSLPLSLPRFPQNELDSMITNPSYANHYQQLDDSNADAPLPARGAPSPRSPSSSSHSSSLPHRND